MSNNKNEEIERLEENDSGAITASVVIIIVVLSWVILGFAAFIMSIVCFGRSGTIGQHITGILLSIFFGPFYWIYFFSVKSYCTKNPIQN